MTILISGGCGFVGCNISLEARKRGYDVIAFDSLIRKGVESNISVLEKAGVTIFRGDVRNDIDLYRLEVEHPDITAIIHLAGNPGIPWSIKYPEYDFQVNAGGTINILQLAHRLENIPVIYASTNKVYSDLINEVPITKGKTRYAWSQAHDGWMEGITDKGINEGFPTDSFEKYAHSPYGISKLSGDLYCQEYFLTYKLPVVINRMSCIYGYYQQGVEDQGWIDFFIRQALTNTPTLNIYGDGFQVRDMLWGEDVAKLYLDELEKIDQIKGRVFNVGGGVDNTLSLTEAILYIQEISGKEFALTYHDWRAADQKIYISDTTKVKGALGWKTTVTPKEGIKLIYERYKNI